MDGPIDIVREVFSDDITLKPNTTADLFKVTIIFILCVTGSMLLLFQSLLYGEGFMLLIFFPFIGFLNLLFNHPFDLFTLIGFIAFSIGYMLIIVEAVTGRTDLMGKSSKYIILKHSLFTQLIFIIGLICPLLWYFLCGWGYWLLKLDEGSKRDLNDIKNGSKHLQIEYIRYFNNLITKKHISGDYYNGVEKKIKKLKKGVTVEGNNYLFKLTKEGYKKLMLAFEMIKKHELEIYVPIEPKISTVTPIYSIEEVGKYAECPYCGFNIRETFYEHDGIVRCNKCGAFHHRECFEYYGRKCGSSSCKLKEA